jgi:hypothetical protein
VLRRIFRTNKVEITQTLRNLHKEAIHIAHSSPNIIRISKEKKMGWMRHVARMGDMRNAYKILLGKHKVHDSNVGPETDFPTRNFSFSPGKFQSSPSNYIQTNSFCILSSSLSSPH